MKSRRLAVVLALAALAGPRPLLVSPAEAQAGASASQAQHRVSGRVTQAGTGAPLAGAIVRIQGGSSGVFTDAQGEYTLTVPAGTTSLVFSQIGFASQEVAIAGRSEINVALQAQAIALEGLTVVGYQTVVREKVTGSVAVVKVDEIRNTPSGSAITALQGRVPGLSVSGSGNPLDEGTAVRIRGIKTIGNNDPLYVIDGIPTKGTAVHRLNPEDIESIQVLKDAASASIYGSRASNGVIVVTTKTPERQPVEIKYNSSLTASTYTNKLDVLTTEERGRALWQAAINDGRNPDELPIYEYDWTRRDDGTAVLNRVIVPEYVGDPAKGIRAANTNWYDQVTRTGILQEHNLSAATSGDRGGALLSLGLHDNQGSVKGTEFQRVTARINSSYNFLDGRLTIGENLSVARGQGRQMAGGLGGNVLDLGLLTQPILPVRTESGSWAGPWGAGFDDRDNPVMLIDINAWDRNVIAQVFGNLFANYNLTDDLLATVRFGVDWEQADNRDIQRRYNAGFLGRGENSMSTWKNSDADWTFNSTLNYALDRGRHSATFLGGFEATRNRYSWNSAFKKDFAIETEEYFVENAGTGDQSVSGESGGYSLASFFGKADYDYDNRYLASFTIRRDGSSRFGANNRWGVFPAFTGGWRVSNEAFFPENGIVNDLKLRVGWGRTGNQEIGNSATFFLYTPSYGDEKIWGPSNGTAYPINGANSGVLASGFRRTQSGNGDLRWEESDELNLGMDFQLFGSSVSGSLDYFTRTTRDILMRPGYIAVIGDGGDRSFNGATMEAVGFEAALGYQISAKDLDFSITGNLGAFQNRITELPDEVIRDYPGNVEQTILGRSAQSIFGYVADGIFQNQAEVDSHAVQPGKAVGRLRYKDLNGDGKIDALDQTYIGDSNPDFEYGISSRLAYRNFDLNVFFQGVHGPEIYNGTKMLTDFTSFWSGANYGQRVLDAWTPENRDSSIPALSLSNTNDEARGSTYFVEDGSYLKLRELVLGYTLRGDLLPRSLSTLDGTRLYVRGGNLFTLKKSTTPDPEFPNWAYASPRTITFGVDVSF